MKFKNLLYLFNLLDNDDAVIKDTMEINYYLQKKEFAELSEEIYLMDNVDLDKYKEKPILEIRMGQILFIITKA